MTYAENKKLKTQAKHTGNAGHNEKSKPSNYRNRWV